MTRVRFAPSPTGPLHIGGLRTALFNYLEAKKNEGVFILRIEDTDQNRYVEGSESYIQEALEWCGIIPDEGPVNGGNFGPYRQSERKSIYKAHIDELIQNGSAYYAYDLPEDLRHARSEAEQKGETFKYGSHNRMTFKNSLTLNGSKSEEILKNDCVVRLKVIPGKKVIVYDEIRGNISVETDLLDDKILMKSDGMPTYHFANVIDDKLMEISSVIRGEEWLPSLPIHKLIYEAFGWNTPKFMHLPLILKPDGKGKLSKRDGDKDGYPVFPLNWNKNTPGFREMGFLPEGMVNYLALLGWNDGSENELFNLSELKEAFSVEGIQKGGARFNYEKARWVNHQYILKMKSSILINKKIIRDRLMDYSNEKHESIVDLVKERLHTLKDFEKEISFLKEPEAFDEKEIKKLGREKILTVLNKIHSLIEENKEGFNIKESLFEWSRQEDIPMGVVMRSLRLSLIGRLTGPDLSALCALLGKAVTLKRVRTFINHIK